MLNKFTFGNTPAAIFLVDRLNQLDNKKFTRKISTILCEFRKIIGELIKAHQDGSLSTHTLSVTVELLHDKIENRRGIERLIGQPCARIFDRTKEHLIACHVFLYDLRVMKNR